MGTMERLENFRLRLVRLLPEAYVGIDLTTPQPQVVASDGMAQVMVRYFRNENPEPMEHREQWHIGYAGRLVEITMTFQPYYEEREALVRVVKLLRSGGLLSEERVPAALDRFLTAWTRGIGGPTFTFMADNDRIAVFHIPTRSGIPPVATLVVQYRQVGTFRQPIFRRWADEELDEDDVREFLAMVPLRAA